MRINYQDQIKKEYQLKKTNNLLINTLYILKKENEFS